MNRLLTTFILCAIASTQTICMQKNEMVQIHPQLNIIKIKKPVFDHFWNHYEIVARTKKEDLGIVTYKNTGNFYNDGSWLMKNLRVSADYRKQGIGFKLFKACVEDIQERGGNSLTWTAYPLDGNISEAALVSLYRKMIARLGSDLVRGSQIKDIAFGPTETTQFTITIAQKAENNV